MAIQSGCAAHNASIAVFTSTRATKYPSPAAPDRSRTASVTGDSERAWVALRCSVVMSRSLIELRSGTDGIGSEIASGLRSSLVIARPPYAPTHRGREPQPWARPVAQLARTCEPDRAQGVRAHGEVQRRTVDLDLDVGVGVIR